MVDSDGRIVDLGDDPMLGEAAPNQNATHPTEPQHHDMAQGQSSSYDHGVGAGASSVPERRPVGGKLPNEPEYAMAGEKR